MSEEMNQQDTHTTSQPIQASAAAAAAPSWESQLQQRANELLTQRLSPLKAEIARLQASVAEISTKLIEQTEAPHTEEEAGGLIDHVRSWFSVSTAQAEEDFNTRLAQARADWRSEADRGEQQFQQRLEQAVTEATALARRESAAQIEDIREQLEASRKALTLSLASAQTSSFDQFKVAVEDLDDQRTQADTLAALVRGAAGLAPRVAFFVVKSGDCIGWKAAGFDNGLNDETVRLLTVPGTAETILQDALANFRTVVINSSSPGDNSAVLGSYGSPAPERAVAVPLIIRGKAAAVLYADSGTQAEGSVNTAALETLLRIAGMGIELLPARRGIEPVRSSGRSTQLNATTEATATTAATLASDTDATTLAADAAIAQAASARTATDAPEETPSPTEADQTASASQPAEDRATATTEDLTGKAPAEFQPPATTEEPPADLSAVETQEFEPVAAAGETVPDIDIPPSALPTPEAPTVASLADEPYGDTVEPTADANAFASESDTNGAATFAPTFVPPAATEPAFAGFEEPRFQPDSTRFAAPQIEAPRAQAPVAPSSLGVPTPGSESEQRAHNDARRFARLLVSEIKLYNAAKVNDGRRSFDLYDRLRDEIDRSRKVYDKRVSPTVANLYDYFYDELVQTLAEGEQAKLGNNCPGPVVIAQQ